MKHNEGEHHGWKEKEHCTTSEALNLKGLSVL